MLGFLEPLEAVVADPRSSQGVAFRLEPLTFALHRSSRFGALAWGGGLTRGWVAALPESVQGAAHPSTPARPCVQGSGRAALTFGICAHKSVASGRAVCGRSVTHYLPDLTSLPTNPSLPTHGPRPGGSLLHCLNGSKQGCHRTSAPQIHRSGSPPICKPMHPCIGRTVKPK